MIQPMFFLSFLSSYSSFASLNFHSKEVLGTFSILYISLVIDVLHASELRKAMHEDGNKVYSTTKQKTHEAY